MHAHEQSAQWPWEYYSALFISVLNPIVIETGNARGNPKAEFKAMASIVH